ncbi:hypothetical protein ACIA5D_36935 [Actinoplanes sp. NPDC051513]|uniref:hypothetical protein n=1 Tax=Actinoplanes sp. NPDC051513 TaxID=3363908 RepID=UPI0037879922
MNTTVNKASDIVTGTYGRLTITYRRLFHTWTVTVYSGTLRIDELCQAFDNKVSAWREAQRVATAAFAGTPVADIIAAKPGELVLAEVREIVDAAPASLDVYRQARQTFPTRTNVHCQPLTPAELDLVRNHNGGAVSTKVGQSWLVLRGIVRRGYGTPVYGCGTKIVAVELNQRGLAAAGEQVAK